MDDDSFAQFLHDVFTTLSTCVRKGTTVYVAHADTYGEQFRAAFREAGFHLASCLVWRKNVMVLGRSDYQWRHEPILYGWMPGAAHYWDGGRRQTTVAETAGPEIVQLEDGSIQVQGVDNAYVIRGREINIETLVGSVITVDKPSRSADHPTTKPVELIERQLVNSCPPGSVVVDVFGGSGSTLIACNKIGRKARLMELDPRYVDVIVRRWEDLTGQKAVLCPQADDQNPQPSTTLKEPATGGAITSRNLVEFPAARSI
jgi:DNA modification methylase